MSNAELLNLHAETVAAFGDEWTKFRQFSDDCILQCAGSYFDLVNAEMLSSESVVLDVGCGSGRWAQYLSGFVKIVECIDPSTAVDVAKDALINKGIKNVRITQAGIDDMPFPDGSFDFVMCLGVLHHLPRAGEGVVRCVEKLKAGGWFLVYIYYDLENRPYVYRALFRLVTMVRKKISKLPPFFKKALCDVIASTIYYPLAKFSALMNFIGLPAKHLEMFPLSFYRDKAFWIMRNDALDRFGTPLEQRFSQNQIREMLEMAGLVNIKFSDKAPYWHAVAQKSWS
ncbi:MAG: class I SAM-dependent methyltransferase [Myxococcota bacterium]